MHALLLGLALAAAPSRSVLVLDLNVREGVSKDLGATLSELLAVEVRKVASGQRILGAADIKALLNFKRQKALLGCDDQSCLTELGGALGAQEIVAGSLSILADQYVLVLRRIDVAKSQVIEETTDDIPLAATGSLQRATRDAVDRLWGVAKPAVPEAAVVVPPPTPHRSRALPLVLGGVAVAAIVASVVGWVEVGSFESLRTQSTKSAVSYAQATSAQSAAVAGEVVGIAGLVVAAGCGAGAVLTW